MSLLFALATPIFGLELALRAEYALPFSALPEDTLALVAADEFDGRAEESLPTEPGDTVVPTPVETAPEVLPTPAEAAAAAGGGPSVADQMAQRARVARIHRGFGIATWGAMTVTELVGLFQYVNLYGVFASQGATPCVRGHAIGGSGACLGQPVLHGVTSGLTGVLYYTTFGLSFRMPDPIGLDEGDSAAARQLRRHKNLRWVHFTGMALQGVLGTLIANDRAIGLDRANHFRALQGLATIHLAIGFATYGALTSSGIRMMRR